MNLSVSENNTRAIIAVLNDLSCCNRCIIRFLGVTALDNENAYKNQEDFLSQIENKNKKPENTILSETNPKKHKKKSMLNLLGLF